MENDKKEIKYRKFFGRERCLVSWDKCPLAIGTQSHLPSLGDI